MGLLSEKCLPPGILIGFQLEWDQEVQNVAAQQEKDRNISCQCARAFCYFSGE